MHAHLFCSTIDRRRGSPYNTVYVPLPLSRFAAVRSSSPVPIERRLRPLPAGSAVRPPPSAMPSTPSLREGLDSLQEKSSRPHSAHSSLPRRASRADVPGDLLHQSPRLFGKPTSLWTLDLLAELCHSRGWTPRILSGEAIRVALKRLDKASASAAPNTGSPAWTRSLWRKKARDRLIRLAETHPDWVLGFQDDALVVASGPTAPAQLGRGRTAALGRARRRPHRPRPWAAAGLLRLALVRTQAGCCCGSCKADPVGVIVTEDFLAWVCQRLAAEGKQRCCWSGITPPGTSASECGAAPRRTTRVKHEGGCRVVVCRLPSKSPWLNSIGFKLGAW